MSHAMQVAIARLYTEPAARHALYRGDASAFEAGELSPVEVGRLRDFARENRDRLELYSAIVANKKAAQTRKRFPVLAAALDAIRVDGWNKAWLSYAEATEGRRELSLYEGEHSLLAFLDALSAEFGASEELLKDALRYERHKWHLARAPGPAQVVEASPDPGCPWSRPFQSEEFRYDLLTLVSGTRAREESIRPRAARILFFWHPTRMSVTTARATAAVSALLAVCDGRTSHTEITQTLRRAGVERASETSVRAALDQLMAIGLVCVRKGASDDA